MPRYATGLQAIPTTDISRQSVAAAALLSAGADRLQLNQALAFGLTNLAWASGQAVGAATTGVLAQATSDFLPYGLLAATCLATLAVLQSRVRRPARQAG